MNEWEYCYVDTPLRRFYLLSKVSTKRCVVGDDFMELVAIYDCIDRSQIP